MKNQTFNQDGKFLISLCEEHFQCNLKEKNRVINNVNARMCFGSLMRLRGYIFSNIGKLIDRDHATIMHYNNKIDIYLKTDEDFKKKFNLVKEEFDLKRIDNRLKTTNDFINIKNNKDIMSIPHIYEKLIDYINTLNNENKALYLEIDNLKIEKDIRNSSIDRVKNLIDMVVQRTRIGKEEEIKFKLNKFYNAMEY